MISLCHLCDSLVFFLSRIQFTGFSHFFPLLYALLLKHNQIYQTNLTSHFVSADIEDLNICYVLHKEENATSDLFHFTVEDKGKSFNIFFFLSVCIKTSLHPRPQTLEF